MPARLRAMQVSGNAVALVAELDAAVVGVVTAHTFATMHSSSPVVWLTALVVSERARGSGVGRALVQRAEDWARSVGATRIAVTSGAQRKDAHEFYRRIGYAQTGVRFGKAL
jgi:GNAT superfamily N-acetyltransferase